jgi:hypothetical protein
MHRDIPSAVLRGLPVGRGELELAQRVMRKSYPLYEALTTGVPLVVDTPIIENLNYLQCSWAYGALYSNRRDFTFAQRVFRENPQYRGVPTTSVTRFATAMPVEEKA